MAFLTIDLAAAEKISDLTVFGFGLGLVFIGLICIILLCVILSTILKRTVADTPNVAPTAPAPAPLENQTEINNRGEFVAAVASVMAEELGMDVSGIRILSIKKL